MRRLRPGSRLAGATILAVMGACVATPAAVALAQARGVPVGAALGLLAAVLVGPAYAAVALTDRDAGRVLAHGAARRRRTEALAHRLATAPLPFACDPDAFAALVQEELDRLPPGFASAVTDAGTTVAVADLDEDNPLALGLFRRRPFAPGSMVGGGRHVDEQTEITLFRRPLVHAAGSPERLPQVVRETLLHELGHLLGMTEADLDRFSIGNRPRPDAITVR